MKQKIALIMINYNGWQDTLNCLSSIENLIKSSADIKLFLIDNNSVDDSRKKIQNYLSSERSIDVEFILSDKNYGFSRGNNLGLQRALDEEFTHFMLLNNDTIIEEDILGASIRFFEKHPDCQVIALHTTRPDGQRELYCTRARPSLLNQLALYHTPFWNKPWFPGYKNHYMLDQDHGRPFPVYAGSGACLAFKREYFDKTGLFDENTFLFGEEFIIAERCRQHGMQTWFMPEPRVVHMGGQTTKQVKAFSFIEFCKSERYFCLKYLGYGLPGVSLISAVRLAKYLFYCVNSDDYRKNLRSFLRWLVSLAKESLPDKEMKGS